MYSPEIKNLSSRNHEVSVRGELLDSTNSGRMDDSSSESLKLTSTFKEELLSEIRGMLSEFTAQIYGEHKPRFGLRPAEGDPDLMEALLYSDRNLESVTQEKLRVESEMSIMVEKLNNKNSKLLEDIEEAAVREQEQKRRIEDLEAEIQNLKSYISNLPPAEELSELKFHVYASNQVQERLQKSNFVLKANLQAAHDKAASLEKKLKTIGSNLENVQSKLDKANEQLEAEKSLRNKADQLDPNNLISLVSANDRLSRENARLHQAVLELDKRRNQDSSQLKACREELSKQADDHKRKMDNLLTELDEERKITTLQREQVQARTVDLEAERQSRSKLKQELHVARNSQTTTAEVFQVVEKMLERLSTSITRLTSVISAEKDLARGKIPDAQQVLCTNPIDNSFEAKPKRHTLQEQLEDARRMTVEFGKLEDAISKLTEDISERYCEMLVTDISYDLS